MLNLKSKLFFFQNVLNGLLNNTSNIYDKLSKCARPVEVQESGSNDILNNIGFLQLSSRQTDIIAAVNEMLKKLGSKVTGTDRETRPDFFFEVKSPVRLFTGRNKELIELHERLEQRTRHFPDSQIIALSGLGGIGKTELVRMYAATYRKNYNSIIWINSERDDTICDSFDRLAKDVLGIPTIDANGGKKHVSSIVDAVYKYLENNSGKCLIVFDDAKDAESLYKYLPLGLHIPCGSHPVVLITSPNKDWPTWTDVIILNEWKMNDAMEFLKRALPSDTTGIDQLTQLVETLQRHPLALQQAVSYILRRKVRNHSYTIASYLQAYATIKKQLLSSEICSDVLNDYKKTAFLTWKDTFNAIAVDEYGAVSIKIMHCIAYFLAEKIPIKIFLKITNGSEDILYEAIHLLAKFSLVVEEYKIGHLRISKLVQDVIQIQLKDDFGDVAALSTCLELLVPEITPDMVEHARCIWKHSEKYPTLVEKYSCVANQIIECLLEQRMYQTGVKYAVTALPTLENILGKEHRDVLEMEKKVARIRVLGIKGGHCGIANQHGGM